MHIVDTTLFFAPASGGVKRYLLAKHQFLASQRGIKHTIVVPGPATRAPSPGVVTVASPPIPGGHGYRLPLNMRHWSGVICDLKPDLIEAGDPYHLAWAALQAARRLDVPPVAATVPDYEVRSWLGIATSKGVPAPVVEKLNREVRAVLELPEVRGKLEAMGNEVRGTSPEEMRTMIASEIARWKQVIGAAKIPQQ